MHVVQSKLGTKILLGLFYFCHSRLFYSRYSFYFSISHSLYYCYAHFCSILSILLLLSLLFYFFFSLLFYFFFLLSILDVPSPLFPQQHSCSFETRPRVGTVGVDKLLFLHADSFCLNLQSIIHPTKQYMRIGSS